MLCYLVRAVWRNSLLSVQLCSPEGFTVTQSLHLLSLTLSLFLTFPSHSLPLSVCVCASVCECVCVHASACECVCACVRTCVCVCVWVSPHLSFLGFETVAFECVPVLGLILTDTQRSQRWTHVAELNIVLFWAQLNRHTYTALASHTHTYTALASHRHTYTALASHRQALITHVTQTSTDVQQITMVHTTHTQSTLSPYAYHYIQPSSYY
jgi:hypothetical protein